MKQTLALAVLLIVSVAASGVASAVSNKCTVVEVETKKLVLECERDTEGLAAGDQVKLKSVAKRTAVEGC